MANTNTFSSSKRAVGKGLAKRRRISNKSNSSSADYRGFSSNAITRTKEVSDAVDKEHTTEAFNEIEYDYKVFTNIEDVDAYIMEQEKQQTTKFILNRICKRFGAHTLEMTALKKQRIKWIASGVKFMGKPFVLVGDKRYDCRHGKDKNVGKKEKYNERRKNLLCSGEQQRINNSRKSEPVKLGCPALVHIRDILVYTEFAVHGALVNDHDLPSIKDPTNSDSYVKHNAQRRLRDRTSAKIRLLLNKDVKLKTERQFHVTFPKLVAHKGHEVGQAAGNSQPVDRRIIIQIQKLVSEGVIHVEDMKKRLEDYVRHLYIGDDLPDKRNRRFYPLAKDISNHIQKAMAALMSSKLGCGHLENLVTQIKKENASDIVYFRPEDHGKSNLLYVHQSCDQKWLHDMNLMGSFSLDVKYRAKKSSNPMFLISVQTAAGHQTVATFIIENETKENIAEALSVLKSYHAEWRPCQWVVDVIPERIEALHMSFPDATVVFHENLPRQGNKCQQKNAVSQSPVCLEDKLKGIVEELHRIIPVLPTSVRTWSLVNNLEQLLTQFKAAIDTNNSSAPVIHNNRGLDGSSASGKPVKRPYHLCNTVSNILADHPANLDHIQQNSINPHFPSKTLPNDIMSIGNGLEDFASAVDLFTRSQQDTITDQQSSFYHSSSQMLPSHGSLTQYHHSSEQSRRHSLTQPVNHHATHGGMPFNSTASTVPHINFLQQGYQLSNAVSGIYNSLTDVRYAEYKQSESQSFIQRIAKTPCDKIPT